MGGGTDRWVWLTLLLVLVLSGLVAYVGDTIGRRIGRKRLTFLGMRPKNTAIFFTVLTGMLIAALTIGTVLLLSEGARDRLLRYTETVNTLTQRAEEQRRLAERQDRLRRRADTAFAEAQRKLGEADAELVSATRRLEAAETRSRLAEQRAEQDQRRAAEARRELAAARRNLQTARLRLEQAGRAVRGLNDQITGLRAIRDDLTRQRLELSGELDKATIEVSRAVDILVNTRREGERRLQEVEAELAAARARLEASRTELAAAQGELIRWGASNLIAEFGQELSRSLLRAGRTRADTLNQLDTFFRMVNRQARELGAGTTTDDVYAVPFGVTADGTLVPEERLRFELAALPENRAFWLRAVSLRNTPPGRPVWYSVRVDPDRIIFSEGELIASTIIDGRQDEVQIALALEKLVQDEVNTVARRLRLLPNPDGRYAEVGPEIWLPALKKIKAIDARALVSVNAARLIRVGDRLEVTFLVEPEGYD